MKKIAIGMAVFLLALFAAVYYAPRFIESELTRRLNQQQVYFNALKVSLFPQPSAVLSQVHWEDSKHIVEVRQLTIDLDFQSLLNLENSTKKLSFEQVKLWRVGESKPDFNNINGRVEGDIWFAPNEVHFKDLSAEILFDKKILLNTQEIKFTAEQGKFSSASPAQYQLNVVKAQINGEAFASLQSQIQLLPDQSLRRFQAELEQASAEKSHLVLARNLRESDQQIFVSGKNILVEQWSRILNLPTLLTGWADVEGNLSMEDNKILQGNTRLFVRQGELKGFNIFQMIEKYIPVNVNPDEVSENSINTTFEALRAQFNWNSHQFNLQALHFQNGKIIVRGVGNADLQEMQCDLNLNVGLRNPHLQHLSLPLQLVGDCSAPKYKVEFDRSLRQGLKELFRSKFR